MSIVDELSKLLVDLELKVEKKRNIIKAMHRELPVYLIIKLTPSSKKAVIELEADEELSDTLVDLLESGEDIEDIVDTVLSELRDAAIEVSNVLEEKDYIVSLKIREGERDVRDQLEEVLEEYSGEEE